MLTMEVVFNCLHYCYWCGICKFTISNVTVAQNQVLWFQ